MNLSAISDFVQFVIVQPSSGAGVCYADFDTAHTHSGRDSGLGRSHFDCCGRRSLVALKSQGPYALVMVVHCTISCNTPTVGWWLIIKLGLVSVGITIAIWSAFLGIAYILLN